MSFSCYFQILLVISEIQLTLHQVHTVHTVKLAVSLKWQVGFENDMKITPIFTINFISKIFHALTVRVSQSNGINVQTGKLMLATSFSG